MKATEQTMQQIDRMLNKVMDKFPKEAETMLLTDIHLRVNQETGEFVAFDDDDHELTRTIVDEWIANQADDFYDQITVAIRQALARRKADIEALPILKPWSVVLETEDKEHMAELFVVDDEQQIIAPELMEGLDKELDDFLAGLLKE